MQKYMRLRCALAINAFVLGLAAGCGSVGAVVGQFCTASDANCADDENCRFADGACDGLLPIGRCTARPEACTLEYAPVCGCDGQTYGNRCQAAAAGTSVSNDGVCEGDGSGAVCGGLQGLACENEDEYCNYVDAFCGAADQTGICVLKPDACAEIFAPVCGCDDKTYGNACEAASAGISVQSTGECPGDDGDTGGPG